jgi:hypothetical protein
MDSMKEPKPSQDLADAAELVDLMESDPLVAAGVLESGAMQHLNEALLLLGAVFGAMENRWPRHIDRPELKSITEPRLVKRF